MYEVDSLYNKIYWVPVDDIFLKFTLSVRDTQDWATQLKHEQNYHYSRHHCIVKQFHMSVSAH